MSPPINISVIVPIRNEAGTIHELLSRIPNLGDGTEAILIEGGSTDDSWVIAQSEATGWAPGQVVVLQQPGRGKADAVRHGISAARGRYIVILDADLGVDPEVIPQFIEPLQAGRAGLVNGVRPTADQEAGAMRFANRLGNRLFAMVLSWVLGVRLADALCGTKAFSRESWDYWRQKTASWSRRDPFGDFEILAGARLLKLPIEEIPVVYRTRKYGATNIHRWRDGLRLARLTLLIAMEMRRSRREAA